LINITTVTIDISIYFFFFFLFIYLQLNALGSKGSRGIKTKQKKKFKKNYWDDQRSDASLSGKLKQYGQCFIQALFGGENSPQESKIPPQEKFQ